MDTQQDRLLQFDRDLLTDKIKYRSINYLIKVI